MGQVLTSVRTRIDSGRQQPQVPARSRNRLFLPAHHVLTAITPRVNSLFIRPRRLHPVDPAQVPWLVKHMAGNNSFHNRDMPEQDCRDNPRTGQAGFPETVVCNDWDTPCGCPGCQKRNRRRTPAQSHAKKATRKPAGSLPGFFACCASCPPLTSTDRVFHH